MSIIIKEVSTLALLSLLYNFLDWLKGTILSLFPWTIKVGTPVSVYVEGDIVLR
ncbi:hypothetical protein H3Z85_12710 [Chryseobacterium indologenes]|nr:hypothetical protein H3Z85_12710 [Chryseobacterium indologenes]